MALIIYVYPFPLKSLRTTHMSHKLRIRLNQGKKSVSFLSMTYWGTLYYDRLIIGRQNGEKLRKKPKDFIWSTGIPYFTCLSFKCFIFGHSLIFFSNFGTFIFRPFQFSTLIGNTGYTSILSSSFFWMKGLKNINAQTLKASLHCVKKCLLN